MPKRGTYPFTTTIEAEARTMSNEQDTIETIVHAIPNFQITSDMFQMDEAVSHTPLKDLA